MSKQPSICFVEAQAYAVLNAATRRVSTGGESVQHTLLARAFAQAGWRTTMVSQDIGQEDGVTIDGVQVFKTYAHAAGLPYVRFVHPRLTSTWRALKKADADVYFQSCAGLMTGVVARFANRHNRKMIFRVAHDLECMPNDQLVAIARDRWLYEYGLQRADLISAQSAVQTKLLKGNYDLPSVIVDMAAEIPGQPDDSKRDIDVLWVNNLRDFKRPELVPDIARAMPGTSFVMIGGKMRGSEALYERVEEESRSIENLDFRGAVPYSEVNSYFSRAKIFLNTSDSEGFPNSFLQSWVRSVPVVSYFDPDGFIESSNLGAAVENQQAFVAPLRGLLSNDDERKTIGRRARQFVIERYSPDAIVARYEALIRECFGLDNPNG